MGNGIPDADRELRLNALLLDYVEAVERGERPDRSRLLDSYPEYAEEFRAFFATRDQLVHMTTPLRLSAGDGSRWARTTEPDAAGLAPAPVETRRLPGTTLGRVGDFRLIREIGRGGMGIVYEAEQVPLRRRVALKVLPLAAAIDPRHLQRFRNEAQAAAQLHHSNIVPVYAVGSEGGFHYYAMQFIDGPSLAQLLTKLRDGCRPSAGAGRDQIDRHLSPEALAVDTTPGRPTETDPNSSTIATEHSSRRRDYFRRVADLVGQAADALEYAHQAGIVHRDVKPANLLLDAVGRLWVTDFGLALIRSDAGLTATGELVGTVRYMSPEQALGKPGLVDHRTDIYSLGVTLYELLTLAPLFEGEDRRALLRQLADVEPRPLRAVDRAIPAELETIVLKAVAKLPVDRYASAREFADDIRRFLDGRPVVARRPSLVDRATKWVRRHRAATAAGVGALLVLAIGFAVSTAVVAREHAATKRAYESEQRANERERQRAEEALKNYSRAKRAVDLFVELSDEELLDFPPLAALRQRLLEAAVAYYQELTDHHGDQRLLADLEASRARLARLQEELAALNDINTAMLLSQPPVRADLDLRPEQAARLAPLLDGLKAHQQTSPPAARGGRRQQIAQFAAECRRDVEGVLTATQHRRLRQILLQIPGPHAFGPSVLTALEATDTQRAEARRVLAEATQASLRIVGTAETRAEGHARFDELWRDATARIVALLAPAQRDRWSAMTGPPVRGEIRFPVPAPDHQK